MATTGAYMASAMTLPATPSGTEFRINTNTAKQQENPSVAALSDGGFVVDLAVVGSGWP